MNSSIKLNSRKWRLYRDENSGWQQAIELQAREIPVMEKMLAETLVTETCSTDDIAGKDLFYQQLEAQQLAMAKINDAIKEQQQRLETNDTKDMNAFIDAFCTQQVLRERITSIEKTYIELKYNFMNYLSNIF